MNCTNTVVNSAAPNNKQALIWSDYNQNWVPAEVNAVQLQGVIVDSNVPANVREFQLTFSLPVSTYNSKNFTNASCENFIITDASGIKIPFWGVPNSCRNGNATLFTKMPVTTESQYLKVVLSIEIVGTDRYRCP